VSASADAGIAGASDGAGASGGAVRADVAVIGMGRMGSAMAERLAATGLTVTVANRTRVRAEEVAVRCGATVAASARQAAASAPVVVVSLADDRAVDEAYAGPDGIAAGVHGSTVIADTSTVDPRTALRARDRVMAAGGGFLDAPVSGSVPSVVRGELAILVGGDAETLERARPVLERLATRIFHIGPAGCGAVMKLAVNGVVHALNLALSEALVLAESAGIDRDRAYDAIAASAGGAPYVAYKRGAFLDPSGTPVAFTLDLVAKDLDLVLELARRYTAPMAQGAANRAAVAAAIDAGFGAADISAMAVYLRSGS